MFEADARLVGDAFYIGGGLYPIVVDGAFAFLVRQDSDLAAQMLLIVHLVSVQRDVLASQGRRKVASQVQSISV